MTVTITSGVTSSGLNVSSGDPVVVKSGGVIETSTVLSGGAVTLSNGAIGSSLYVSSGGVVSGLGSLTGSTTVDGLVSGSLDAGTVYVGGSALGLDIQSGASLSVTSGGLASGSVIEQGGSEQVLADGEDKKATLSSNSFININSEALGVDVTASGNAALIYNYGLLSKAVVVDGATAYDYGVASGTKVADGGVMYDFSSAYGDIVSSGGVENVFGGSAVGTVLKDGGSALISGGLGEDYTVSRGGTLIVSSTGTVSGGTVLSGGAVAFAGGTAVGLAVQSGGALAFGGDITSNFTAGQVASTTVVSGVTLSSGAFETLYSATVMSGVTVSLASGAVAQRLTVLSGASVVGAGELSYANVSGTISGVTVGDNGANRGSEVYLYSGGVAEDVKIVGSSIMETDSATTVSATTVAGGSELVIFGSATDTVVESSAIAGVLGGAETGGVVRNGGFFYVLDGSANDLRVQSGGSLYLVSAQTMSDVTVASGGVVGLGGDISSFTAKEVTTTTMVESGVTLSSGGFLDLFEATLVDAARVRISSGARTSQIALSEDSVDFILAGGEAMQTIIEGGTKEIVSAGGLASGSLVFASGFQYALASGTTTGTTVSSGGREIVSSGGVADATLVADGGTLAVMGAASGTVVGEAGHEVVSSGGVASGALVSSGGVEYVQAGGTARGAQLSGGGHQVVSSGGVASGTTVLSGGVAFLSSGALGVGSVISRSGREIISAGATGSNVDLAGGVLVDNGTVRMSAGGTLAGTLSGSGSIAQTVGGDLLISGRSSSFTGKVVISGGTVELATSGAIGTGAVQFAAPSTGSAVLQIDAASATPVDGFFANTLSNFSGTNEALDLTSIAYSSGMTTFTSGSTLVLTDGGDYYAFALSGSQSNNYVAVSDGHGGTLIEAAPAVLSVPSVDVMTQAMAAFAPSKSAAIVQSANASSSTQALFAHATTSAAR